MNKILLFFYQREDNLQLIDMARRPSSLLYFSFSCFIYIKIILIFFCFSLLWNDEETSLSLFLDYRNVKETSFALTGNLIKFMIIRMFSSYFLLLFLIDKKIRANKKKQNLASLFFSSIFCSNFESIYIYN